MWNWLVTFLASEATVVLYDGAPSYPGPEVLFDYADAAGINLFGTSAKFIDALGNAGLKPMESHDLSSIRTITSTGSPLVPEGFDYIYQNVKRDVCLSSIAGGTDIVGLLCRRQSDAAGLAGGNSMQADPAWRRTCSTDRGNSVIGEKGELVLHQTVPLHAGGFSGPIPMARAITMPISRASRISGTTAISWS